MITKQFPLATLAELSNWNSHVNTCNIPSPSFWYVASPYAKYCEGKEEAYREACRYAHDLILAGVLVFAPIAHSHSIATVCEMDKSSHDLWMPQDLAILSAANGVLICPMSGWRLSKGIAMEIEAAELVGKPVYMLDVHW